MLAVPLYGKRAVLCSILRDVCFEAITLRATPNAAPPRCNNYITQRRITTRKETLKKFTTRSDDQSQHQDLERPEASDRQGFPKQNGQNQK